MEADFSYFNITDLEAVNIREELNFTEMINIVQLINYTDTKKEIKRLNKITTSIDDVNNYFYKLYASRLRQIFQRIIPIDEERINIAKEWQNARENFSFSLIGIIWFYLRESYKSDNLTMQMYNKITYNRDKALEEYDYILKTLKFDSEDEGEDEKTEYIFSYTLAYKVLYIYLKEIEKELIKEYGKIPKPSQIPKKATQQSESNKQLFQQYSSLYDYSTIKNFNMYFKKAELFKLFDIFTKTQEAANAYDADFVDYIYLNNYLYFKNRDKILGYLQKVLSSKINYKDRFTDDIIVNFGILTIDDLETYVEKDDINIYYKKTFEVMDILGNIDSKDIKKEIRDFLKDYGFEFTKKKSLLLFATGYFFVKRFIAEFDEYEEQYNEYLKINEANASANIIKGAIKGLIAKKQMATLQQLDIQTKTPIMTKASNTIKGAIKGLLAKKKMARLKRKKDKAEAKATREKVLNPKTGRYVYKDGTIGKKL